MIIKIYKLLFFSVVSYLGVASSYANAIKDAMLPEGEGVNQNRLTGSGGSGEAQLDNLSTSIISVIDALLPITAVGVFLFIGIRLAIARGNPEEFKKSFLQLVYVVVGIFVISFAWAAVKLVAGIQI